MNAITPQQPPQLPTYMQALAAKSQGSALLQNVSAGNSMHQIGLKQARFRLQAPDGSEEVVQQFHLDVIVVDANPNLSKVYYIGAYNPAEEGKAPDCYSDNGVAPSQRAGKPQCGSCAQCPHNVWGSRVTENGAQTKSCADSRKIAVVLADNPTGPVYLIRVPAASIKNSRDYAEAIVNRGYPIEGIITRLTFDSTADYPKLMFAAVGWANEVQVAAVMKVVGTDETKMVVGLNDKPRTEALPAPAPTSVAALPSQPAYVPPAPGANPAAGPLANFPAPPIGAPTNFVEQPAVKITRARKKAAPVEQAPQPAGAGDPLAFANAPQVADQSVYAPGFAPQAPQPTFDSPGQAAASAVQLHASPTNAALDALLGEALKA